MVADRRGDGSRGDAVDLKIYAEFRKGIAAGTLPLGTKLPTERELAMRHGVSRKLIRRALNRLRDDGLVERRVGSGTFVRPHEQETSDWSAALPVISPLDAIEARRVLEAGAAELVVIRANDLDFDAIEERLADMKVAHDPGAFRAAAFAFNLAVIKATHNPLLIAMYEMLIAARAQAGWNRLGYLVATPEQRAETIASNQRFLELLRQRDGVEACRHKHRRLSMMIQRILAVSAES